MDEHLTVGRLAGLAGVTVRTLHHYDEIGLVRPSARTAAGYRVYAPGDVDRLRQVLTYRRLGEWADEAERRWGDTDACRQSRRRAASYSKEDWARIKAEADANAQAFAAALRAGAPADGEHAADLAERHRQHISRYFYDCGYAMHRGLAAMYLDDPRFTGGYDAVEPGLARYVHDAIVANAARREPAS